MNTRSKSSTVLYGGTVRWFREVIRHTLSDDSEHARHRPQHELKAESGSQLLRVDCLADRADCLADRGWVWPGCTYVRQPKT